MPAKENDVKTTQKKRFGFLALVIIFALALGFVLTSCLNDDGGHDGSGSGPSFNPVGTWTATSHYSGPYGWGEDQYMLSIRANGTFTMIETYREVNQSGSINTGTRTLNGTYSVFSASILLTFPEYQGAQRLGEIVDNNTIIININNRTVFTRSGT
jgi:hypothetical protein